MNKTITFANSCFKLQLTTAILSVYVVEDNLLHKVLDLNYVLEEALQFEIVFLNALYLPTDYGTPINFVRCLLSSDEFKTAAYELIKKELTK